MKRLAVVAVVLALGTACQSSFRGRTARPPSPDPAETTKVGQGIVFLTPSPTPASAVRTNAPSSAGPSTAGFAIRIRDQNGNRPLGIPVRFDGPVRRVVFSDSAGTARLSAPPGRYTMAIDTGCHGAVIIDRGARGTVHTVAGQTSDADVSVEWRHRFGPSGNATSDAGGDWVVGRQVRVFYDIIDRCRDDRAANAPYPTFAFRPSANVAVVGRPVMKADGSARGTVTVRCTRAGEVSLVLLDKANPPDRQELIGAATSYGGRPRCVN